MRFVFLVMILVMSVFASAKEASVYGFVKTTELSDYIDDMVPEIAEKVFKRAQYLTASPNGQAFPIAKIK